MLLGIILLPLLMSFSLICRMWAFLVTHVIYLWGERIVLSFWAGVRGLGVSLACLFFGPGKWVCAPIFQTLSVVVMKVEVLVDEVRQPS